MASQFGKYRIERELGRGATGIVYLATDTQRRQQVALKVLVIPHTVQDSAQAQVIERFRREARAGIAIHHPCVPKIYEVGESSGNHYIAMEYCPGRTLRDRLMTEGPLWQAEALRIVNQILAALEAAHTKGVSHRDVKPENVMLLPDGSVKLMDFGIARAMGDATLTHTGMVNGTPAYMSPEQVSGRPVDGRSDLFAVGVILHEMLTGHRPFEGRTIPEILHAIAYNEPVLSPSLYAPIRNVLHVALAKEPSQRFQSATSMAAALTSDLQAAGSSQASPKPHPIRPATVPSPAQAMPQVNGGAAPQPFLLPAPVQHPFPQHGTSRSSARKNNGTAIVAVGIGMLILAWLFFTAYNANQASYREGDTSPEPSISMPVAPENTRSEPALPSTSETTKPLSISSTPAPQTSAESRVCQTCGGKGKVPCWNCEHTGRCPTCGGKRMIVCTVCGGQGQWVCSSCGGTGRGIGFGFGGFGGGGLGGGGFGGGGLATMCPVCGGTGIEKCVSCNSLGHLACPDCFGTGACRVCQGDKYLQCPDCKGKKVR